MAAEAARLAAASTASGSGSRSDASAPVLPSGSRWAWSGGWLSYGLVRPVHCLICQMNDVVCRMSGNGRMPGFALYGVFLRMVALRACQLFPTIGPLKLGQLRSLCFSVHSLHTNSHYYLRSLFHPSCPKLSRVFPTNRHDSCLGFFRQLVL
ncbi:hypothetical protein GE09DRAFT_552892 [Coniochaeta sp. 2T2.1]|nr:hypothetical protein GE09DRAFT_552892 [Coniochaeta sp. 2T2.1]